VPLRDDSQCRGNIIGVALLASPSAMGESGRCTINYDLSEKYEIGEGAVC
jgi:hypothetical protein